jgi:hypothetical protein
MSTVHRADLHLRDCHEKIAPFNASEIALKAKYFSILLGRRKKTDFLEMHLACLHNRGIDPRMHHEQSPRRDTYIQALSASAWRHSAIAQPHLPLDHRNPAFTIASRHHERVPNLLRILTAVFQPATAEPGGQPCVGVGSLTRLLEHCVLW